MTSASYASLHAGLLARKGEARPVPEPTTFTGTAPAPVFQHTNLRAVIRPPAQPARPVATVADHDPIDDLFAESEREMQAEAQQAPVDGAVADMKARIRDAYRSWPSAKSAVPPAPQQRARPEPEYDPAPDDDWRPALAPQGAARHPVRSSVRMTNAQARALRLASLVLDRPQQELLEAGLEAQLKALACTDLANCACFQAVLAMMEERRQV